MRRVVLSLSVLVLSCGLALSQPAAPAPAPAQVDRQLDDYLLRWEQEMAKIQTLAANLVRVEKDPVFKQTQKYVGSAQYMKVGSGKDVANLAILEMRPENRNELSEKIIITATHIFQYQPARKEITAFPLPQPKQGQVADDNLSTLLFGVKATEARRRYELKLVNQDPYYIYVSITPRATQDKSEFQRARLVLNKDNFLPRQLWFEEPTGREVTWDIPAIRANIQLRRQDFDAPTPPPDWKMLQGNRADAAPRMSRQP